MRIIVAALALCALSLQAQADCTCVCVNEQLQPYCRPADDIADAKPCIGVCGPVTAPAPPKRSDSTTVTIIRNMKREVYDHLPPCSAPMRDNGPLPSNWPCGRMPYPRDR